MKGFKVGFGSPAAMAQLGIDRPLVGRSAETLLADGATVDLSGWTEPDDRARGRRPRGRRASRVAIELADVNPPPDDPEAILAGNIFHRHVLLGPVVRDEPGAGTLRRDGDVVARADDAAALTGGYEAVVRVVEDTIGRALEPGEVVITGSIVPPPPCEPGERWEGEIERLGRLVVTMGRGLRWHCTRTARWAWTGRSASASTGCARSGSRASRQSWRRPTWARCCAST